MKRRIENLSKFRKLFWDAEDSEDFDVSAIDIDNYGFFIIERCLEYGDFPEVKWMFEHYPPKTIKEALCSSRELSKKSAKFWKFILGRINAY